MATREGGARTGARAASERVPRPRPSRDRRRRPALAAAGRTNAATARPSAHVDLWSVLKVSICFYLCGLLVTLTAGVVLWWIASAAGVVSNVEQFVGDLVNNKNFHFLSWEVLRTRDAGRASSLVCLLIVVTMLAAAFYNLFAELLGGVEVTVVEEETRRPVATRCGRLASPARSGL